MLSLTAHHLRFKLRVETAIELEQHQGAALRGMLFNALRGPKHNPALGFCTQRHLPTCAECALLAVCPVAGLVATLNPEAERGRDIPRPYAITPPLSGQMRYEPGELFNFGLTLFGQALALFPYVVMAMRQAGPAGLGKRLPPAGNGGPYRRGRFTVEAAAAINLLTGEVQDILEPNSRLVQQPALPVTHAQILETSRLLLATAPGQPPESDDSLLDFTLIFQTPVRLIVDKKLLKTPHFGPLFHRLLDRLLALERAFGGRGEASIDKNGLLALADQVRLVTNQTHWQEVWSYSARQSRKTPISGLVGSATYRASRQVWAGLLPFVLWGQVIHIGKNAVKGDGMIAVSG